MPRFILMMGALLISSHQAFGDDFLFTENFDGYVKDSKASQNNKNPADSPVIWSDEAYTRIALMSEVGRLEKDGGLVGLAELKPKENHKITSNSIARSETHSAGLLFSYREGPNSWSEQRFKLNQEVLGKKGLTEMWIQYDLFIPDNYRAIDGNPDSGQWFGGGHKVLTMYADAYSYPNTTMIFGQLFARKDKNGVTNYDGHAYNNSTLSTYKDGERIYTYFGVDKAREKAWIFVDRDLGKWQRRTVRFKFPTTETSNDGVVQVWIQRADGNVSTLIDVTNGNFFAYNQSYFNAGYFNGWCNDGLDGQTYFLLDNVIITDNRKYIDRSAIIEDNPPNSPDARRTQ